MGVPTGVSFTAKVTRSHELTFRCNACHFEAEAVVTGTGQGEEGAPLWIGRDRAKARAVEVASNKTLPHAQLLVTLAKCPSCGWRDAVAIDRCKKRALTRCILAALGLTIGVPALAALLEERGVELPIAWVLPIALLLVPLSIWNTASEDWLRADRRVRFVREVEAGAPAGGREEPAQSASTGGEREPRRSTPQIAGKLCAACAKKLLGEFEAEVCGTCRAVTHEGACAATHLRERHGGAEGPYR